MTFFDFFKKTKLTDKPPVVLLILDGWGEAHAWGGNAISMGRTPNFDALWNNYPHFTLKAAEESVGLPSAMPGNSEVGHVALGAGKVIHQHLYLINQAIEDQTFFKNEVLIKAIQTAKDRGSKLHILGMLSIGAQVHGSINHIYALCQLAKQQELSQVYIHGFADGRDAPQQDGFKETHRLEDKLKELGVGRIATITGRYFAMDRNKRYERTEKTYNAMVLGLGDKYKSADECFVQSYAKEITDEYILPSIITGDNNQPVATIDDNDVVIFANFRADRTRQISKALCNGDFNGFHRKKKPDIYFASMAFFSPNLPQNIAFKIKSDGQTLGEVIAAHGISQYRIAESQKYPHATYFLNGGRENPFPHEYRTMIPSLENINYDQAPEMSIDKVVKNLVNQIRHNKYDTYICNFANPDMTGHTGDLSATIAGCEYTDEGIGQVWEAVKQQNGVLIVTADHGNAEQMIDIITGRPDPEHTKNPVPCIIASPDQRFVANDHLPAGHILELKEIAPTMLSILGLPSGEGMTGLPLVIKK